MEMLWGAEELAMNRKVLIWALAGVIVFISSAQTKYGDGSVEPAELMSVLYNAADYDL